MVAKISLLDFRSLCPNHRSHEIFYVLITLCSAALTTIGIYASRERCEVECAQDLYLFVYHYGAYITGEILSFLFIGKEIWLIHLLLNFSTNFEHGLCLITNSSRTKTLYSILLCWWWCWRWCWKCLMLCGLCRFQY